MKLKFVLHHRMKELARCYLMFYVQVHWLVTAGLLSAEPLLQTIHRERKPIQLDHNGLLPLMLRETDRGENFVLYEDDSMIIFSCEKYLSVLQEM